MNNKELLQRGWIESKIKKWLPEDYMMEDVIKIEESSKFKNWTKRTEARITKGNEKFREALEGDKFVLERIELEELMTNVIEARFAISGDCDSEWLRKNSSRLMDNYIRHELCGSYDRAIKALNGHPKRDELYERLREILSVEIKRVYPDLHSHTFTVDEIEEMVKSIR